MDLGIAGRTALICASSKGLGRSCAEALAAEGVSITITGRDPTLLEGTAKAMRARYRVSVATATGDISTEAGRAAALRACPAPDILVNNAGGPPIGDWRNFTADQWHAAIDSNLLSAVMLTRDVIDGMADRGFGRIINITSALVKQPTAMLSLSVAARLGLSGFMKGISEQYASHNVTINNLLPEQFETDRLRSNMAKLAVARNKTIEEVREEGITSNPSRRFGRVEEFGAVCAFYASAHAGYLTGQNILIDGGRYPGIF